MRAHVLTAALAALAFAQTAAAATVSIAPVSLDPEFQARAGQRAALNDYRTEAFDQSDVAYLQRRVDDAVRAALTQAGADVGQGGGYVLDVTIVNADPNRPTMAQLRQRPGLDWINSVSTGGATLHGVLRDASGAVVADIDHEYYTPSLDWVYATSGAWFDADRSIRGFARKVADAYRARASA